MVRFFSDFNCEIPQGGAIEASGDLCKTVKHDMYCHGPESSHPDLIINDRCDLAKKILKHRRPVNKNVGFFMKKWAWLIWLNSSEHPRSNIFTVHDLRGPYYGQYCSRCMQGTLQHNFFLQ